MIDKPGKGAFYQTDLELMLKNREIDTLFVCGVTTEVCVNTTVREANDRGFRCIVLSDCCASYFPEFHAAGLAMIKAQGGIFGWVSASPFCWRRWIQVEQSRRRDHQRLCSVRAANLHKVLPICAPQYREPLGFASSLLHA